MMNKCLKVATFLAAIVGGLAVPAGPPRRAETLYRDDFSVARGRFEFYGGKPWKMGGGQCRFAVPGHESFAVVSTEDLQQAQIEATLAVDRRLDAGGFATAGVTLFGDPENHWRLLLVAGPEDRRYFELVERHAGVHQAQHAKPPARTLLAGKHEGSLTAWEYGRSYRLVLSVTPQSIVGEIRDDGNKAFWRMTYTFGGSQAVRSGRPGLTAGGLTGSVRTLTVEGERPAVADLLQVPAGRLGSAAIVRDESNRVAPVLERLLAKEGFGTKIVSWEDLSQHRVSGDHLDLLVLADARRVPVSVARAAVSFLRSRGKLIAVGAPAFGDLLFKTSQGYVSVERYAEAIYDGLAKRRVPLSAKGWRRSAMKSERAATIEQESPSARRGSPDPAGTTWKISSDFEGWDNFVHPVADAFADGHGLLCFRAKGDANTPQLSLECNEKDGSRWIATVELTPQWRNYVLWPSDFLYWHDSRAKRGGPGDRFHPAAAATIHIGLSSSHTPRCKSGPHTFWIADLAAAPDAGVAQPDVQLPEIEGLYPSYKLYPLGDVLETSPIQTATQAPLKGYASVWREGGIGFDRGRPWRWIRMLDALDSSRRKAGALVSLMLGESVFPGAMWLNVGVADPTVLSREPASVSMIVAEAKAMTRGCFLLEGGSRYFSYRPGERVQFGALVVNAGRREQFLSVKFTLPAFGRDSVRFEKAVPFTLPPGERRDVSVEWDAAPGGSCLPACVEVRLSCQSVGVLDLLSHRIDTLSERPACPDEFVKVEGSHFTLGGKPWYMLGINYRPTSQGGRPTLDMFRRDVYDPEILERDMKWMESAGINLLSAIHAPVPEDPDDPGAYRDLHDFLERCRRHQMKVFYFLNSANPLAGGSFEAIKRHIDAAGIKNHPAILSWELSWEPIYYSGPAGGRMDFLIPDWNAWIVERYGSVASAERDWGYTLPRRTGFQPVRNGLKSRPTGTETVGLPKPEWCSTHGPWDKLAAAFRRFFSDHVGRAYGRVIRELRRYDPNHLVTFRFGACGIPDGARFAHAHSAAVAKHVDFLCPEGYNLQSGWAKATPADDLRKGGLVTLFYRFLSREKPVVWMEFGYTVNGFRGKWKTGMEHIAPAELAIQRTEYENFYRMFLESGARGAAPWWLPGGFRLGEQSDFGILEPDGSERPAAQVLKRLQPDFAKVGDATCVAPAETARDPGRPVLTLDLDAHYADAWQRYAPQYLQHVTSGRLPYLRTAGTGTTSADCPLLAVGNTPLSGHNPPQFLNAEFNRIEVKEEGKPWRELLPGESLPLKKGSAPRFRASVGNTAEAAWLAPDKAAGNPEGRVFLRATLQPSGKTFDVPIPHTTPYLADVEVGPFALGIEDRKEQRYTFRMITTRHAQNGPALTIPFGQERAIRVILQ